MVTVKIKENSKKAREIIEMLKSQPFVEFIDTPRYNATTEKVIRDARAGKGLIKVKDIDDLMTQLNG